MKINPYFLSAAMVMALVISASAANAATLLAWDATGLSGITLDPWSATSVLANMEPSAMTRGAGLNASSLSDGFAASGWNGPTDLTGAAAADNYFQFTAEASSGFLLSADSIELNFRTTASGPMVIQFQYSLDGFSTDGVSIQSPISRTNPGSGTQVDNYSVDLSAISGLQDVSGAVTFRLFGWNSTSAAGTAAIGTTSGDNLVLVGDVAAVPEPTSLALGGVGLVALAGIARARRKVAKTN